MILNNYWKYMYSVENDYYRIGEGNTSINTGCIDVTGHSVTIAHSTAGNAYLLGDNFAVRSNLTVRVGSGNTDPASNNYCLESDLMSSVANLQVSTIMSTTDSCLKTIISASGKNSSASTDFTIREIGICKNIRNTEYPSSFNASIMFIRHILDEPIEVPAYGNFAFTFEWIER